MHDTGKIILGIIVFLGIFTFPFYYNGFYMENYLPPEKIEKQVNTMKNKHPQYVDSKNLTFSEMRATHMQFLDHWREGVVRHGDRTTVKGLQLTCFMCHSKNQEVKKMAPSCNGCHEYIGVNLYCWQCHIDPADPDDLKKKNLTN